MERELGSDEVQLRLAALSLDPDTSKKNSCQGIALAVQLTAQPALSPEIQLALVCTARLHPSINKYEHHEASLCLPCIDRACLFISYCTIPYHIISVLGYPARLAS